MTVGTLRPCQDKPALPSIAFVMSVAGLFHHLVLSCPKVTVSGKGRAGKHSFSYVQNCRLVPDLCSLSCLHRLESASPEMTKTRPCWRPAQAKTDWRKIGHTVERSGAGDPTKVTGTEHGRTKAWATTCPNLPCRCRLARHTAAIHTVNPP